MTIGTSTCYELLADAQRRAVVAVLEPDRPPVALADLARQVAAYEPACSTDSGGEPSELKRVHVSLYNCHVPKLADADVVSFDADRRTVTDGPNFETLESFRDAHIEVVQ